MKILVCVKVIKGDINPFDESALECAFSLSDDVTVISMGPESTKDALLPLTRLGAKVHLISDSVFAGSDTLATSYILSSYINTLDYDLILCGRQSVDGDTAQVGPMLSDKLGINLITNAMKVEVSDSNVSCITRLGEEMVDLPALVTVERGYILRFPSLFSKAGNVEVFDNDYIECDTSKCGLAGSPTRVIQTFENETGKRKCKFITKTELIPLINELKTKSKEKEENTYSGQKLHSVWAIGDEVAHKASEIAENVIVIKEKSPDEICMRALAEKPQVILWNADLWGRKIAPVVASKLDTGLCADCTHLECDGDTLFMFRPAQGGNIYAKIKCLTTPQMATVRTNVNSSDIIVSGGKGVADIMDSVSDFAKKIRAELGASRGLVDMNKAPYEHQIGLTGKTVSPKIYIAIGISGAVHHTSAIEGSDTIIAINPNKDARIFEYADYGIVANWEDIYDI